jgi:hypothetical protein
VKCSSVLLKEGFNSVLKSNGDFNAIQSNVKEHNTSQILKKKLLNFRKSSGSQVLSCSHVNLTNFIEVAQVLSYSNFFFLICMNNRMEEEVITEEIELTITLVSTKSLKSPA